MKTLSQLKESRQQALDIQEDSMNYINVAELKKYLELTDKFISDDAKYVIDWLIEHNGTYVKDFGGENALASFYERGIPKDAAYKKLYAAIGRLNKSGRLIEIPVFQNKEQFEGILNKEISPDEILLDLNTEKGRNAVAKKYDPLVWKIARSYIGKSSFTLQELYTIGLEGLVWAMNSYGKKSKKMQKKEEATGEELVDMKKYKAYTFLSFAAHNISFSILEAIKNESHIVRIPVSQQQKERNETGRNTVSNSISGDQTIGRDSDGNGKSLFDYMDDGEKGGKSIDDEDIAKIWDEIYSILDKKFDERTMDIFYSANGLRGRKEVKKKDLAAKYNTAQSNITALLNKVKFFIINDKKVKGLFTDVLELMGESRQEEADNMVENNHYVKEAGKLIDNE